MKINPYLALSILSATSLLATPAMAAELHVPLDFNSLQEAIDQANSEDVIYLDSGEYAEHISINQINITIVGDASTVLTAPEGFSGPIIDINDAAVSLEGLRIDGKNWAGSDKFYGLKASGSTIRLSNSTIEGINSATCPSCQIGVGILVVPDAETGEGSAIELENVIISDYQKAGLVVDGSDTQGIIKFSTITGSGDEAGVAQIGLQFSRGAVGEVLECTINNNRSTVGATASGVLISDTQDSIVYRGNFTGNQASVFNNGGEGTIIEDSLFQGTGLEPFEIGVILASTHEEGADLITWTHTNVFRDLTNSQYIDATSTGAISSRNIFYNSPYESYSSTSLQLRDRDNNNLPSLRLSVENSEASPYQP